MKADNEIITGTEDKLKRWKQYMEMLYHDDRSALPSLEDIEVVNELGPDITKEEVVHAIKLQKNGKAAKYMRKYSK